MSTIVGPLRATTRASAVVSAFVLAFAGCSTSASSLAPVPTTAAPAAGAIRTDEVQAALDALVDAGAPAAVIEVTSGDESWSGAAGVVDVKGGEPASAGAPVRIASVTKAMVAAVVLQLVEEGTLALDDPVEKTLPGLLPKPVTVRQLLDHTSGVPNYLPALVPATTEGIAAGADTVHTDDELIAAALALPWPNPPGDTFSYSNTNYVLLGRIIERITGVDTAEALDTRIFEPAGMEDSFFAADAALPDGALSGYLLENDELTDVTRYEPSIFSSSGAVVSTVGDLNRFFRALFDGTLLAPLQLAAVQDVPASGYGLGLLAGGDACDPAAGDLVYGQKGNGFGYRVLSFSSPDGQRQVTLAWTATAADPAADPLDKPASAALLTALLATCEP